MKPHEIALMILLCTFSQHAEGQSIFRRVFENITTPQTSANLPNEGQGMHMIAVIIPTATANVTGLQIRIEASYDNQTFFPITRDVQTAVYNGTFAYALERGNGAFPFVRVRALQLSAEPVTVHYTGAQNPIGNVFLSDDRFLATGPGVSYEKHTFVICNGTPCTVGTDLTNKIVAVANTTFERCWIAAKEAPAGAALIVDILTNDASIFGAGTKLELPAGSEIANTTTFENPRVNEGDILRLDVDQVGATTAGQDVTVTCKLAF